MTANEEIIRLELPSSLKYLMIIGDVISGILSTVEDISEFDETVYGVQLAVHEACTNIVEHAYRGRDLNGRIHISLILASSPRRLMIELFDTGISFPQKPIKTPNPDEPTVRGYGRYLIDQLMDEVRYESNQDGNYLYLTKML